MDTRVREKLRFLWSGVLSGKRKEDLERPSKRKGRGVLFFWLGAPEQFVEFLLDAVKPLKVCAVLDPGNIKADNQQDREDRDNGIYTNFTQVHLQGCVRSSPARESG